jgi:hypothetical protein
MLVYLFRQRRTDDLALTTDVTGRNIPSPNPSTDWIFAEAIDISKFEPAWDIADFQCVLRCLKVFGHICSRPRDQTLNEKRT